MESTGQSKDGNVHDKTNPPGGKEYYIDDEYNARFLKLKKFITGSLLLDEVEKWLLMHASDALNLDQV